MSRSRIASLFADHFGMTPHSSGLVNVRSFRSISVSHHRIQDGVWHWEPSRSTASYVAVLFQTDGTAMPTADTDADGMSAIGLFLPATSGRSLEWGPSADLLVVWLPDILLQEYTGGPVSGAVAIYASPLTVGFRTFAHAVARHDGDSSSMSKYAIERLIVEMLFGSLLEQQSIESEQRPSTLIERARSVMLVHREDPEFSTAQLATELHISARQLQRAFARAGATPGDMLRRMRVELAESMLRNPLYAGLTVDELSRYSGFTSALQLRRALQAEGAPSPTVLRRSANG